MNNKTLWSNGLIPKLSLYQASRDCDFEGVKAYLKMGIDVNAKDRNGMTPLFWALETAPDSDCSQTMAELLLTNGADVNAKATGGWTPIHQAAMRGHKTVVAAFIASGANVNAKFGVLGFTPLYFAKSPEMIELLMQHGGKSRMYSWAEAFFLIAEFLKVLSSSGESQFGK